MSNSLHILIAKKSEISLCLGTGTFKEGANHTHYINLKNPSIKVPVPRHKEISDFLAIKICKELDIPLPD